MAKVTIKIPGIGDVEAVNAASEETLLKILAAVNKANKQNQTGTNQNSLNQAQQNATQNINNLNQATTNQTAAANQNAATTRQNTMSSKQAMTQAIAGTKQFGVALGSTAKDMALSVTKLAVGMAANYDNMSKDPIGAAAGMVNTGLDMLKVGVYGAADAAAGITKAFSGIPYIGPVISGLGEAAAAATKAAADLAHALATTANNIFAAEFKKTADAMFLLSKNGASFAGGMLELRNISQSANLPLETMSKAAAAAASSIRDMGFSQGEGIKILAKGMDAASKVIGKSGSNIRGEMLALGFSFEDQMGIMASYGAQLKASGVNLKNLAPAELAKGTKEYAENLKVISDITGQDAKKLMDKAREESMRGALMGKLNAQQRDAFMQANSTLARFGPKWQQALTQQISGGVVTDPMIAGNKEAMAMIQKVAAGVSAGNKDMAVDTQSAMATASENFRKTGETATDMAAAMGSTDPIVTGFAEIGNTMRNYFPTPDEGKKSKQAAEEQSTAVDAVTTGFKSVYDSSNNLAVKMQSLVTDNLSSYARLLDKTMTETVAAFTKAIDWIKGGMKTPSPMSTEFGNQGKLFNTIGFEKTSAATDKTDAIGHMVATWMAFFGSGDAASAIELNEQAKKQKFATGGISSGPKSGYDVELHGTEAVVPLPDGKSIPVTVQKEKTDQSVASTVAATMATTASPTDSQMVELLAELVALLKSQNRSQQDLIDHTRDHKQLIQQLINLSF